MIQKDKLDRIIVETNEQLNPIINWFLEIRDTIDSDEQHAFMDSGLIVLNEEGSDISFEMLDDSRALMAYYPGHINTYGAKWIYDIRNRTITDIKLPAHVNTIQKMRLYAIFAMDRTLEKKSRIFHALMLYGSMHQDTITPKERETVQIKKNKSLNRRKSVKKTFSFVKKVYEVRECQVKHTKRNYTRPNHAVQVRGFYRRLKNGGRTWVKPFARYKGECERKDYKL